MSKLDQLAIKYGSDKSSLHHDYMGFYESVLPANPASIMEIGVLEGASIKIWRDAYPETLLYGVDLFEEYSIPDMPEVVFYKGNQLDHFMLYNIRNNVKPQVIIEDCSHNCIDHWVTMMSLISCCELYIIEDLATCNEPFYQQGLPFDSTILGSMKAGKFPLNFRLHQDKIALIWK